MKWFFYDQFTHDKSKNAIDVVHRSNYIKAQIYYDNRINFVICKQMGFVHIFFDMMHQSTNMFNYLFWFCSRHLIYISIWTECLVFIINTFSLYIFWANSEWVTNKVTIHSESVVFLSSYIQFAINLKSNFDSVSIYHSMVAINYIKHLYNWVRCKVHKEKILSHCWFMKKKPLSGDG